MQWKYTVLCEHVTGSSNPVCGVGSGKINFFTLSSTQFCIVSKAKICKCSLNLLLRELCRKHVYDR